MKTVVFLPDDTEQHGCKPADGCEHEARRAQPAPVKQEPAHKPNAQQPQEECGEEL